MPIYYGSNKIARIFDGTNEISSIYYGGNLVFSGHSETLLGNITVYGSGDYSYSPWSDAQAWLVKDSGKQYLKITGRWGNIGEAVRAEVTAFSTNINVGAQRNTIYFDCMCYFNQYNPGEPYTNYDGYITTGGTLYLPQSHENVPRCFNQYDYYHTLIALNPA